VRQSPIGAIGLTGSDDAVFGKTGSIEVQSLICLLLGTTDTYNMSTVLACDWYKSNVMSHV